MEIEGFSIGLGVAELVAPGAIARGIGLKGRGPALTVTRLCGLRELAAGVGILSQRRAATGCGRGWPAM